MEMNYIKQNREVYDELAEEFEDKIVVREENNNHIASSFTKHLSKNFGDKKYKILELGPGAGYLCKILSERGNDVKAIEFSEKMAGICKKIAPKAHVIVDEFISHDFMGEKFDGILAVAFIHLFPKAEADNVLNKIKDLLNSHGILYIGTTIHNESSEGLYPKINFTKKLTRFRRKFTRDEFENMLKTSGLNIVEKNDYVDNEEVGKTWMDYVVESL